FFVNGRNKQFRWHMQIAAREPTAEYCGRYPVFPASAERPRIYSLANRPPGVHRLAERWFIDPKSPIMQVIKKIKVAFRYDRPVVAFSCSAGITEPTLTF